MISGKQSISDSIFLIQLFILLILSTMVRAQYNVLKDIGDISINLTLAFMLMFLVKSIMERRTFDTKLLKINIAIFLLILIYTISFVISEQAGNWYFIKLMLLFLFILGSIRIKWKPAHIKAIAYLLGIVLIFIFLHWVKLDFPNHKFKSIFTNPNYLAVFLFCMLYFKIIAIKFGSNFERLYFSLLILLNLILIYNTNARSVVVAMVVILIAWIFMKQFTRMYPFLFHIVITLNVVFIILYVGIKSTNFGRLLDKISVQIFGKSFFSGRSSLWEGIMQAGIEKPIMGYGVGINANDVTGIKLTAHNQYLQTFLEVGLVGFAIFVFLLFCIWKLLISRLDSFAAKWSACFFLGILVYENFELTLFQNNYSIAFLQWLIITIGISFSDDTKREEGQHL
ncbi:O-antigen ligase [Virgibacillus subterraneus]|uniref:O-antigen ligase n=1 Tax=Virgibacillus subterraneus TaxID=621109 RepID=A0A1H9AEM3_9BACI|nr:O-antigen ligase family protein [Virgibacillus subterraneus]SEP75242.1 O-antigen ligase [Virgibacillus subterraneus]